MGFWPCKADPDVWLKECDTHYEDVCVYSDDIMVFSKNADNCFDSLKDKFNFKLKHVGEPAYHLSGDLNRDPDGTLAW
jgi:hypothetical protein